MLPGPQVGDPYTAIALKGLLETLLDQGTIIVSTSNLPIRQLNSHGVHEDLFTGFQERLLAACNEVELSAEQDYRLSFGRAELQEVPPCSSTLSVLALPQAALSACAATLAVWAMPLHGAVTGKHVSRQYQAWLDSLQ